MSRRPGVGIGNGAPDDDACRSPSASRLEAPGARGAPEQHLVAGLEVEPVGDEAIPSWCLRVSAISSASAPTKAASFREADLGLVCACSPTRVGGQNAVGVDGPRSRPAWHRPERAAVQEAARPRRGTRAATRSSRPASASAPSGESCRPAEPPARAPPATLASRRRRRRAAEPTRSLQKAGARTGRCCSTGTDVVVGLHDSSLCRRPGALGSGSGWPGPRVRSGIIVAADAPAGSATGAYCP